MQVQILCHLCLFRKENRNCVVNFDVRHLFEHGLYKKSDKLLQLLIFLFFYFLFYFFFFIIFMEIRLYIIGISKYEYIIFKCTH